MKKMIFGLASFLLVVGQAQATSFAVLLKSGGQKAALESTAKALKTPVRRNILTSSVELLSELNSYVHVQVSSERAARELKATLQRSGEEVLSDERARAVLQSLAQRKPQALELALVEGATVKVQSYFARPTANELRVDYFNLLALGTSNERNAQLMKQQTRGLTSRPTPSHYRLALGKHKTLLKGLTQVDAGGVKGSACGMVYCSCWGAVSCDLGIAACYTIHGDLQDGDPDPWTCDSYDDQGQCVAGSCRLI